MCTTDTYTSGLCFRALGSLGFNLRFLFLSVLPNLHYYEIDLGIKSDYYILCVLRVGLNNAFFQVFCFQVPRTGTKYVIFFVDRGT